jgi:molecular chaperone HtpG
MRPKKKRRNAESQRIPEDEFKGLVERFNEVLGERVTDVRASSRLSQSVARLVDPDGALNPEMQRVYKFIGKDYEVPKKILELNPSHVLLKKLVGPDTDPELRTRVVEQIYDSALLVEGLHPDPSSMAARIQEIMDAALSKKKE